MAEFSDRPMTPPPEEDQYYGFFPAKYVTEYLENYIDDHIYSGQTLRDRIIFSTPIRHIDKTADGLWTVFSYSGTTLKARKLVDATGMTSLPNVPHLQGQEEFQGTIIHHRDFGQSSFLSNPEKQNVVVLGGAKSAADVAYASAKAGKDVSWIIREDGAGPAAFLEAKGGGPYRNSNERFYTRLVASFLPSPFEPKSYLSRFLHGTWLGMWMVATLWDRIDKESRRKVDYHRSEGVQLGFQNLEPDTPVFWQNDSSGINQRPDFYSTIAKHVHVYRQSIEHVSSKSITLAANKKNNAKQCTFIADVVVLCTGWSAASPLYSPALAKQLGLPALYAEHNSADENEWHLLEKAADRRIIDRFPMLRHPPLFRKTEPTRSPFRLYKAMVPLADASDRSVVFLGKMVVGNNFRVAEVQALWAVAYLDGKLSHDMPSMAVEVAETVAWCRRRYLNKGELGSWFYFDVLKYTDMLLTQLELRSHRQKGWLGNWFGPCKAADLRNLTEEYKGLHRVN